MRLIRIKVTWLVHVNWLYGVSNDLLSYGTSSLIYCPIALWHILLHYGTSYCTMAHPMVLILPYYDKASILTRYPLVSVLPYCTMVLFYCSMMSQLTTYPLAMLHHYLSILTYCTVVLTYCPVAFESSPPILDWCMWL